MISVTNLGMHFEKKTLFSAVNFQLNKGNCYGVVGANGTGKSTLVKIFSGEIYPEKGQVNYPTSLHMGILSQDHYKYETDTIIDIVLMGKPTLWNAIKEKDSLSNELNLTLKNGERLAELEMLISDQNGYQAESDASTIIAGLGIPQHQHYQQLKTLSGGYKTRVLMAQCLFSDPDFLILDEPTNHLDLPSIVWLEAFLNQFTGMSLIVSHDQYFLNRISTHIVDIDYETIKIYPGNYDRFLEAKALEQMQKESEIERQEKRKEELEQFILRFRAKATKARQAKSKAKQLDRIEDIVIKRSSHISPRFSFDIIRPSGQKAFEVKNLSKSFDSKKVIRNVSLSIQRGEKVGVIGPNGVGKSTFIKLLSGQLDCTEGDIELGYEIKYGYCPQDHKELITSNTSPFEWLYSFAPGETIGYIRGILGRVLFSGDDVDKAIESLSGGESTRLIFAKIMLEKPNLLLLDEPTNHMDIDSVVALSDALNDYQGTIVCVSHDRKFIESFATVILELKEDGYDLFRGNYQEYVEKYEKDYLERNPVRVEKTQSNDKMLSNGGNKLSWKRQKEINRLEKRVQKSENNISELEVEMQKIEEKLANSELYEEGNQEILEELISTKKAIKSKLDTTIRDWESQQTKLDTLLIQTEG
jgi:ATPase subunit of ABC transporter with duplicated ATPase domains